MVSPCEVSISVVIVVVHKYSGLPESRVVYIPSDLGNDPLLVRNHMVNRGHVPGSCLRDLTDEPT